jgi:hypothetical protein
MTTDSEAWPQPLTPEQAYLAVLTRRLAAGWGTDSADAQAGAVLTLYRERQKRGDFGAPGKSSPPPGPSRLDAMEAPPLSKMNAGEPNVRAISGYWARRAGIAERERDNLQSLLNAERVKREQAEARAEALSRDAGNYQAQRDEQRTRAEAAEKAAAGEFKRATEAEKALVGVGALLKEALGHLQLVRKFPDYATGDATRDLLERAHAAGYVPEGETP